MTGLFVAVLFVAGMGWLLWAIGREQKRKPPRPESGLPGLLMLLAFGAVAVMVMVRLAGWLL